MGEQSEKLAFWIASNVTLPLSESIKKREKNYDELQVREDTIGSLIVTLGTIPRQIILNQSIKLTESLVKRKL